MASSPGCVLAASQTGRPARSVRSRASSASSAGKGGAANFRLPRHSTAPPLSRASRSATAADCACSIVKAPNTVRAVRGMRCQAAKLPGDSRPFTSASGMPRAAQPASRFGQISLSTNAAASGRQWSRNRAAQRGTSSGTKRCSTRPSSPSSGRRCASIRAEVSVPVVISTETSGGRAVSTGSTDTLSPTLAACSHSSRPGGRGVASMPRRSPSLAASSLPARARRDSISSKAGAASVVSPA